MGILEDFYYGNIRPFEKLVEEHSEFKEALDEAERKKKKLLSILTEDEKKLFDDYANADMIVSAVAEREEFIKGFKLGLSFMSEAK